MTEIDMTRVAALVTSTYGIEAVVEQTGGEVATIYAGHYALDVERWPVAAGPGWFTDRSWSQAYGSLDDFYIGPDDQGEIKPVSTDRSWTEERCAREIAVHYYAQKIMDMIDTDIDGYARRGDERRALGLTNARSFSELHDFVDANEYMIHAEVPYDFDDETVMAFYVDVQSEVTRRLADQIVGLVVRQQDETGHADERRLREAVQDGIDAFWAKIAAAYPEATSGDMDPMVVFTFDQQCEAIVKLWIEYNVDDDDN